MHWSTAVHPSRVFRSMAAKEVLREWEQREFHEWAWNFLRNLPFKLYCKLLNSKKINKLEQLPQENQDKQMDRPCQPSFHHRRHPLPLFQLILCIQWPQRPWVRPQGSQIFSGLCGYLPRHLQHSLRSLLICKSFYAWGKNNRRKEGKIFIVTLEKIYLPSWITFNLSTDHYHRR